MSRSCTAMTDAALVQELAQLASILSGSSDEGKASSQDDWKDRSAALAQLQVYAEEDISSRPTFGELYASTIKIPLQEQIRDKRSAVVQAACRVVVAFARSSTNRSLWASMCVGFVEPLLRVTTSTTKVTASAGVNALQAIARSRGFGPEALGELLKGCRARHAAARLSALSALLTLMQQVRGTPQQLAFARLHSTVSSVISSAVTDASADVRAVGRRCYWALYSMEPQVASSLYNSFESSVRALVDRERADALRSVEAVEADKVIESTEQGIPTQKTPPVAITVATSVDRRTLGNSGSGLNEQTGRSDAEVVDPQRTHSTSRSPRRRRTSQPAASLSTAARRQKQHRRLSSGPATLQSTHPDSAATLREVTNSDSSGAVVLRESKGTEEAIVVALGSESVRLEMVKRWKVVEAELRHTDWHVRLEGIETLRGFIGELQPYDDLLSEAVADLIRRIGDPHFRVCLAALENFDAFLNQENILLLQSHLQSVFLTMLTNSCSRREAVREAACRTLMRLLALVDVEAAVRSLLQCLDDINTPVVQGAILEVLEVVFRLKSEDFSELILMGPTVRALIHQLRLEEGSERGRRQGHIWPAAVAALKTLNSEAPHPFEKTALALSGDDRALLREALMDPGTYSRRLMIHEPATINQRRISPTEAAVLRSPHNQKALGVQTSPQITPERSAPRVTFTTHDVPGPDHPSVASVSSANKTVKSPDESPSAACFSRPFRSPAKSPQPRHVMQVKGALFQTDYAPHNFIDPTEPLTAAFPGPLEEGLIGRSSPTAARDARVPSHRTATLMRGRRCSGDAAVPAVTPAGSNFVSPIFDGGLRESCATPATLVEQLMAPNATGDELSTTLHSILESLSSCRESWPANDLVQLLGVLFDRFCTESVQPQHTVRRRAFSVLRNLLVMPALRPTIARNAGRLVRVCRAAIDDAFFDVQQEAALVMFTGLHHSNLPVDLRLNALCGVIEGWQRGRFRDECTRGWLEVLSELGRTLEEVQSHGAAANPRSSDRDGDKNWQRGGSGGGGGSGGSSTMASVGVLRRVVRIAQWCSEHCAAEVRRTAILVLVAFWMSLGKAAYPFLTSLTATQRTLVSIYYNKARIAKDDASGSDSIAEMMKELLTGGDDSSDVRRTQRFVDLNRNMLAAGFGEATAL